MCTEKPFLMRDGPKWRSRSIRVCLDIEREYFNSDVLFILKSIIFLRLVFV